MGINYVRRTSKSNRQELLNRALKEELEFLRKKCFPWKRRDFLIDDVEIKEKVFEVDKEGTTLGLYEYDENEFIHKIYVNKSKIWLTQKMNQAWHRKSLYIELREIIRHELVHAFVKEQFENKFKYFITEKNRDASPIFLAVLYFVDGYTSHTCLKGFRHTELYELARYEVDTYKELKGYLIHEYIEKYAEAIHEIKEITNKEEILKQKDVDYYNIINDFQFAPRVNGLEKFCEINHKNIYNNDGKLKEYKSITRTWHVGCNVEPAQLLELYNRKQDCKAKNYNYKKELIILPKNKEIKEIDVKKDIKMITVKEEKNFG